MTSRRRKHALILITTIAVLVGGYFTTLAGRMCSKLGRLNHTDPATQTLDYDGTNVIWQRGGAGPEVWRTTLEHFTNGLTWTDLGAGARIPGGWQWAGVSLPRNATLRARGHVAGGGRQTVTDWFVEGYYGQPLLVSPLAVGTNRNQGDKVALRVQAVGSSPLSFQ